MNELLSTLIAISVPLFAVSSMLTVGFRYTVREIIEPLRDIPGVITALLANFVLVPLLAAGILQLIRLDRPFAIGLLIVATAAGAPLVIKLTVLARDDVAFAASMLVLLLLITIIYMPLVVPRIAAEASVSAMSIARPLILTMLLPLLIAFGVKAFLPRWAEALLPYARMLTNIALYVMLVSTLLANSNEVVSVFGTGAILASFLLIGGAFAIGYLVGTFDKHEKVVLGFATAQRNFAAAIVVAVQSFTGSGVLVMTIVCSTVAMLFLPLAGLIGKYRAKSTHTQEQSVTS